MPATIRTGTATSPTVPSRCVSAAICRWRSRRRFSAPTRRASMGWTADERPSRVEDLGARAVPGPQRHDAGTATGLLTLPLAAIRVLLACIWTSIVGTPLMVALYVRYWYGLLRAKLGRRDILDR